jgi:mRNA-decapping enzyme 1B
MTLNKTSSTAINIVQTTTTVSNNTPQSVMNFFAAAKQPAASEVPLFQRLLSNPVQTVEQIEKQHRTSTPSGKVTPDVTEIENSFKFMSIPGQGSHGPEMGTSPLATFLNSSNLTAQRGVGPILKAKAVDVSEIESTQQPLHELLKKSEQQQNTSINSSANSNSMNTTPGKPALMPPTMFQSSTSKVRSNNLDSSQTNNNHHQIPEPLTQNQLIQAIDYLIRNDPDFIKKLHEAYLKSFTEMVLTQIN